MLLNGMKVVSFCHFLQGPAAMQYLADMGAEIVKIEASHVVMISHPQEVADVIVKAAKAVMKS